MKIRSLNSEQDIQDCIALSFKGYAATDKEWFKPDLQLATDNMRNIWLTSGFIQVIEKKNKIVAWGTASVVTPSFHSRTRAFKQNYYHTNLEGFSAVRALKLFHQTMVTHATANRIPVCISESYQENADVFFRILEREGWTQRGSYMMIKTTQQLPSEDRR